MKVGIDSYCYHRYFGELYPFQPEPKEKISFLNFIEKCKQWKIDGVALETVFMPSFEKSYLENIRNDLKEYGIEIVLSWGHSVKGEHGLKASINSKKEIKEALDDLIKHFETATTLESKVMRITGGAQRDEPKDPQINRLSKTLKKVADVASSYDIKIALENHVDFTSDEILKIIENVKSDYIGVNFDTGNTLRVFEDPIKAAEKLAPYIYSTHVKDIGIKKSGAPKDWNFWWAVPIGQGIIDFPKILRILKNEGLDGVLAIEFDCLMDVDEKISEDEASEISIQYLRNTLLNL